MMAFRRLSEEEHINTHAEGLRIPVDTVPHQYFHCNYGGFRKGNIIIVITCTSSKRSTTPDVMRGKLRQ